MKYIVFLLSLSILVFGDNPKVYSSLGDSIYNSVDKVVKLKTVESFTQYSQDIDSYKVNVNELKKIGFSLDNSVDILAQEKYLSSLRKLDKEYYFYLRESYRVLNNSIENEDTKTFDALLQTDLIDINHNKKNILKFYAEHKAKITLTPSMNEILVKERQKKLKTNNLQRNIEQDRVNRIRQSSKRKEENLEKKLQEENQKKKLEIRNKQKEELSL